MALKKIRYNDNEVVKVGSKANKIVVNLFKNNKSRKLTHMLYIRATKKLIFLTSNAKKAFNHLK